MKRIFLAFCALFLLTSAVQAKDVSRVIVENATVGEVENTILKVIDMYAGVVTPIKLDKVNHRYSVALNNTTVFDVLGLSNKEWAKSVYSTASYACAVEPYQTHDVLLTCRKSKRKVLWARQMTFDHYEKVYEELEFQGKTIRKY